MNFTLFYSWQSDISNKLNRSFILEVLEKASKEFSIDDRYSLDTVIDRDTFGIPGSPSIVEAITAKIAKSDVFVCDVSIINSLSNGRQVPNPNVLFELGYASAILGWERIILVQNSAFGGPDKLPFDLRGRRVIQYFLDENLENKSIEKEKLKAQLVANFHMALEYYSSEYNVKEKVIWFGKWEMESNIKARGGHLFINRISSDAFYFSIDIYDGARTGDISGKAKILTPHSAYFRIKTSDTLDCEIVFSRRNDNGHWFIEIEEGFNCSSYHGHNSSFSGTYKHTSEKLIDNGYLDEVDLTELKRLTGNNFEVFLNNFQRIGFEKDEFNNEISVIVGGVKGLYTVMESIVALDKFGSIWCAFLDPKFSVVRYFTNVNDSNEVKPKSIIEWLSRFSDKKILTNVFE